MSNRTYDNLLMEAKLILAETINTDALMQNEEPQLNKLIFHNAASELYYKYILVANKLNICYDQVTHPQKRILIRRLLDGCLGRVLELKNDLVNLEISEYTFNDGVLISLNVSPMEAEIDVPRYFHRERRSDIVYKRKFIDDVLHNLGFEEEAHIKKPPTELEAVRIIQIHERARQGRLRGQFMKEIRLLKEKGKPDSQKGKEELSHSSALMIQRMWRGYMTRRNIKKRKTDEMLLIGMTAPPLTFSETRQRARDVENYRHEVQTLHEKEYIEAQESIEKTIVEKRSGVIMEEIADELRAWFKEYYVNSGKFPEFPSQESGGSRVMFSRQGTESEISKSTVMSSKESKKSKEKEDKNKTNKESTKIEFSGYKCGSSGFLQDIIAACEEYDEVWKYKDDNLHQKHNEEIIYKEKYAKVESDTRLIVDEIMRSEVELLQAALDKDRGHKGKKSKKKSRKGGKKSKKKKEKDLTPDRTTESLFEELVTNGIIKKYPETSIDSFVGEKSFAEYELRKSGKSTPTCLGDIRQAIKEYCIIPLGSEYIHESSPLIRSILITGPSGSGKKMLVHAICTELGAVLFDLTPANIVGKYPGKTGLIMLVHLINKVSRLLQPSVIFMDNAEKPFVKKVPKTDKTDPKRLKKDLSKIVKGIATEDKIIFIGTTSCPWDADQKPLMQTFQKYIQIPRPDYGTISLLWKSQLQQYNGIDPNFDISPIAKLSDGYTIGEILKVIKSVITTKRMLQLRVRQLTHAELIVALSKHEPVYREEDEASEQWWAKTPLGKKKLKSMESEEGSRRESKEKKKGKK